MATASLARIPPQVQHNFDGDVRVLNATFDTRLAIRKGLTTLAQELQKMERQPIQVIGEIQIKTGGPEAKLNVYTITVTDNAFDENDFARRVALTEAKISRVTPSVNEHVSHPPSAQQDEQLEDHVQSPLIRKSHSRSEDDEVVEIRPFKRSRVEGKGSNPTPILDSKTSPRETSAFANEHGREQQDLLFPFIKEWRDEWVRQGGWLFDNITKANNSAENSKVELERKMESVQDVLGQSLNSASVSAMGELANISKLIPWLEHCRKANDDKVQAREEKWRSSSATFHDQARREREAAEARIEKKLDEQRALLLKLTRASGVPIEDGEDHEGANPDASRETSLGAQLTRELNMEAARSGTDSRSDAGGESINRNDRR